MNDLVTVRLTHDQLAFLRELLDEAEPTWEDSTFAYREEKSRQLRELRRAIAQQEGKADGKA